MKKFFKYFLLVLLGVQAALLAIPEHVEAAWDPAIYTISGTEFIDTQKNGVYNPFQLDTPVKNHTIKLYDSLAAAQAEEAPIRQTTTNALGAYSFTKLTKGTYYLRYGNAEGFSPVKQPQTPLNTDGTAAMGIVEVKATSLITTVNLAVTKTATLNFHVFGDSNGNGLMDPDEKIENYKTVVIVNLKQAAELIKNGGPQVDQSQLISQAMKGSIDIGDGAITLKTTSSNQPIQIPDAASGLYVAFRSPFNLRLSEMIVEMPKINAILDIIFSTQDIGQFVDNPDLLSTGDITTSPDYGYIEELSNFFSFALNQVESLQLEQYLGEDITQLISKGQNIAKLVRNIPKMRFGVVNVWGDTYDLTNLQIKKTADFYFGIRKHVNIKGYVFDDLNQDGIRNGISEPLRSITVTAYDKDGRALASAVSPPRSGTYRLKELPYEKNIYLVAETDFPVQAVDPESLPAALKGKQVVSVYHMSSLEPEWEISKDIALTVN